MSKTFYVNLILLIISHVVFNQRDYDNYDSDYDYSYDRYPRHPIQRPHRFRVRQYSGISKRDGFPKNKGIFSLAFGIVGFGKCLIKCVLVWVKTCDGVITCPWKCLFPKQPLPKKIKQDDSEIVLEPRPKNEPFTALLMPGDIVRLAMCYIKCLLKHLPITISITLMAIHVSQLMICVLTRCLCAGEHYGL